jgi:DDE family transposase
VPNIVGLEERGIKAYLPTSDFSQRTKYYSAKLFRYDSEKDQYVCPQGQILQLTSRRNTEQVILYRAKASVCNACPVKGQCTGSKSGRHIFRSFFQEVLDKAESYRQTEPYLKAVRKRSVWVEPLFGEAKDFYRLRRFRLRRLSKVNIEGVMVAAGQNLKRLIKYHLAFFFSQIRRFALSFPSNPDFFNRLVYCTNNNNPALPSLFLIFESYLILQ